MRIATLVERKTWFVTLIRVPYDRTAERVALLLAVKRETLRVPSQQRNLG